MTQRQMSKVFAAVGVLTWRIFVACPAQADSAASVRKTLQALYDRASAALARKDVAGATAIDAPDYVTIDDKGQSHTLQESRDRAAKLLQRPQTVQLTVQIDKVTLQGANAIVDARQHLYMKYINPRTHHVFVTDQRLVTTDQWVKQGATWLRMRGQTHSVRAYVNGQPAYSTPQKR